MADLLVTRLGGPAFTWGGGSLDSAGAVRTRYIEALRQADRQEISALIAFARS
jgi:hypothetical protein